MELPLGCEVNDWDVKCAINGGVFWMDASFFNSDLFRWVALPILIFLSRVLDVSIGTIRIIFVAKGKKWLAPLCGFFEVLIWLIAIGQVMQNLSNVFCYLAYAAGFAAGNFVGISIEEKLAMGYQVIRVVTARPAGELVDALSSANYGVTYVGAKGANGDVTLIYTVIKRKDLPQVTALLNRFDPKAFFSVEDARGACEGVFPMNTSRRQFGHRFPRGAR